MKYRNSLSRNIFLAFNYTFLIILSFLCIFPLIHILAISFSSSFAASAGMVKFWPVEFTVKSYGFILKKPEFVRSLGMSAERVIFGTVINMFLTIIIAYPLSKDKSSFRFRTIYVWIFVFTILFSGGLIPWYMTIRNTGLLDKIWALVIPGAVPVFNVILLLNFFRVLPKELEESCFLDGAGYWTALWRIFVPLSMPALATITLFTVVGHWNSWFDGLMLMSRPEHYPLSTYLQQIVVQTNLTTNLTPQQLKELSNVSDRTAKAAQIFVGALPILAVYPFLQKYFVTGIVLGSVKE